MLILGDVRIYYVYIYIFWVVYIYISYTSRSLHGLELWDSIVVEHSGETCPGSPINPPHDQCRDRLGPNAFGIHVHVPTCPRPAPPTSRCPISNRLNPYNCRSTARLEVQKLEPQVLRAPRSRRRTTSHQRHAAWWELVLGLELWSISGWKGFGDPVLDGCGSQH